MVEYEEDIINAGAQLVWVLEQTTTFGEGTAAACLAFLEDQGSDAGWCVGDAQTWPEPGTFDESPFGIDRGFDMIVDLADMRITWTSNHGTGANYDNLTGADVLAAVEAAVAEP